MPNTRRLYGINCTSFIFLAHTLRENCCQHGLQLSYLQKRIELGLFPFVLGNMLRCIKVKINDVRGIGP